MSTVSEVFTLRGSIAHRAVLWPFSQPCTGSWLENFKKPKEITAEVDLALDVLMPAVNRAWDTEDVGDYRTAEALLNMCGPSDYKATFAAISSHLGDEDRDKVLGALRRTALFGAEAVEHWLRSRSLTGAQWSCVWSEVPLRFLGLYSSDQSAGTPDCRADLVGFRPNGDIEIVDLKFGNAQPQPWVLNESVKQVEKYIQLAKTQAPVAERRVTGQVLFIDSSPDRKKWTSKRV